MTTDSASTLDAKKVAPKSVKYQREKDREPVRGIFRFLEVPGGSLSFTYGPIYKGDVTERYDLVDGHVYTLPLGVAKHLNKNGWYPMYGYQQDPNGQAQSRQIKKVHRFQFQSLEFVDLDDIGASNEVNIIALHSGN